MQNELSVKTMNGNGRAHAKKGERNGDSTIAAPEAQPVAKSTVQSVITPQSINSRRDHRKDCAAFWQDYPPAEQSPNDDEACYSDFRGNFTKGLHHNASGLVEPADFDELRNALRTGNVNDFIDVSTATSSVLGRPFVNPQAGLAVELLGADPVQLAMAPAPSFNGVVNVAEIIEDYWMALLRDVSFSDFEDSMLAQAAVADFEQKLSDNTTLREALFYKSPQDAATPLTPRKLFRGSFDGEQIGPYLSQFLLQDCFIGAQQIDARMRTVVPGIDYMTTFGDWLAVQRGIKQPKDQFDMTARYIRNGRDLGQWVHIDQLYQAYLLAGLRLLDGGAEVSQSNPYNGYPNQEGFGTFGGAHILSLVTEVATRALKAVWYQKWVVHRRLRPEAFAGRIHTKFSGGADGQTVDFDIHDAIGQVDVLNRIYSAHGTYLLPMAFPEGSPMHPAYGAGHGTVAGACTTILKAWFDGSAKFSTLRHPIDDVPLSPKQAADDGLSLVDYHGEDAEELTIGGELNKLAGNIAIGRNYAGVHWRSDYRESLLLGEKVAISTLMDYTGSFNESGVGFQFTSFTGRKVVIIGHQVWIDNNLVIQQDTPFAEELAGLD